MADASVVVVQQAPGGDRPIDNSEVPNSAASGGTAHCQRTERYIARTDRTEHRAETALPASGAFSNQGLFTIPEGIAKVSYVVKYTKGGSGGFPRFRPRWSNGTEEAFELVLRSNLSVSSHRGRQKVYIQELDGPVPPNGTALTYVLEFEVPAGMVSCRLLAAEAGNTDSPGTCGIYITGGT